jgi:hypothetical protein
MCQTWIPDGDLAPHLPRALTHCTHERRSCAGVLSAWLNLSPSPIRQWQIGSPPSSRRTPACHCPLPQTDWLMRPCGWPSILG